MLINPSILHYPVNLTFCLLDTDTVYTVRPTGFWMDKILHHESKKPITNTSKPRKLIDRTVKYPA
jgi:hypothetical protein